ncbi:MAG TPA: hypothetical protein VF469_00755 [Kofleriaceae bacterium]
MVFRAYPLLVAGITGAMACSAAAGATHAGAEFTEAYRPGTQDVGHWILTDNPLRARIIETTGGHPGGYLYSEVSTPTPTWSTASTRYQPGHDDALKRDSIFVGDYDANQIDHISVDLQIFQVGAWTPDRTVTLQLIRWDPANNTVAFTATYSEGDLPTAPRGWLHHDFAVDARSPTIPPGWVLTRGDGTPGRNADWATLMHQIDLVGFGYWKPGFAYPSLGIWKLGIDNVHVGTR